jgi:hypothetical protein
MSRAALVALVFVAACGGAQRAGEVRTQPLGQARAIEVIEAAVADRDYGATTHNVAATLTNGTVVNVDVLVTSLGAGFVFLNDQDRLDLAGDIPDPADASQLYALLARLEDDREVHVLVVQDTDFEHLFNPRAHDRRPEDRTADDVEARLRRDSLDFLHAIVDLRGGAPD